MGLFTPMLFFGLTGIEDQRKLNRPQSATAPSAKTLCPIMSRPADIGLTLGISKFEGKK
jgi:hypothetical protein